MNSKLSAIEHSCSALDFNFQFTSNKPNKLKNENQFQVKVQQNGDQAKKTSSGKVFLQSPSDFYSTGPENITVISSQTKKCSVCYKKSKIKLQKKRRS